MKISKKRALIFCLILFFIGFLAGWYVTFNTCVNLGVESLKRLGLDKTILDEISRRLGAHI